MGFVLVFAFALTAAVYASAGFGGGSTYTALLAASQVDVALLPIVSLSCNILVVAGGIGRQARNNNVPWRQIVPVTLFSVPMAWIGGRLPVGEDVFLSLLGAALLLAAVLMLAPPRSEPGSSRTVFHPGLLYAAGAGTGLLSGIVGIGGGIFLAPLMHLIGWDTPRRIAAAASVFIFVNSLAGLAGQVAKGGLDQAVAAASFWPLAVAVVVGGQLGAGLAAGLLPERQIRLMTGLLVLIVAIRLIWGVLRRNFLFA